jgi:hypothetical protein
MPQMAAVARKWVIPGRTMRQGQLKVKGLVKAGLPCRFLPIGQSRCPLFSL